MLPQYFGKRYPERHDPRYTEIEQIMREVGVRFYQVVPESEQIYFTAYCVSVKHHMWININHAKQVMICVEELGRILMPPGNLAQKAYVDSVIAGHPLSLTKIFNMYEPDSLEKLAEFMRKTRVLSLTKYWFIRAKLWWNK